MQEFTILTASSCEKNFGRNICNYEESSRVRVLVYDLLSKKAAKLLQSLKDSSKKTKLGAYHASVVVFGYEYSYSGVGYTRTIVEKLKVPGTCNEEELGLTEVSFDDFERYVAKLAKGQFKASNYDLLTNNCQTFAEKLTKFLCNKELPSYIGELAKKIAPVQSWRTWYKQIFT